MELFRQSNSRTERPVPSLEKRDVKRMSAVEFNDALHRDTGYAYFFTDPSTGENIPLERAPDFLLQDEELKTGYEFLKEYGKHLDIQIIFASHSPNSPEDLGNEQFDFEARVKKSDVFLLEGVEWEQKQKEMLNDLSSGRRIDSNDLGEYTSYKTKDGKIKYGNTSTLRILNAISRSKVKVSFYDIENKDDDFGIRQQIIGNTKFADTLANTKFVGEDTEMQEKEVELLRNIALSKQIISLETLREWYMVSNAGYQIAEACQNDPELIQKLGVEKVKVLMLVGESHRDLVRKFDAVGVSVSFDTPNETPQNPTNEKIPKWLSQGFIDRNELKEVEAIQVL